MMQHLTVLEHADAIHVNGKTVQRRAAGQFYTHEIIGRALAHSAVAALAETDEVSLLDPFAGDGRLLAWTIERLAAAGTGRVVVAAWDQDAMGLSSASELVESTAARCGVDLKLELWRGDTFDRAVSERRRWDIVITNPPWELLKPDSRELKRLPPHLHTEYISELKSFDRRLSSEFPTSQPSRKFAGWGTNLSRVGTEVAARMTVQQGVCAVVCPSSLLADSTSATLRRWLLDEFALTEVTHYPAEARLFEAVDVPCCTFVAVRGVRQNGTRLARLKPDRTPGEAGTVQLSRPWLEGRGFSIPAEFGIDGIKLLEELDVHAPLAALEGRQGDGLWAGRELDETGRSRFTVQTGAHPFVRSIHVPRLGQPSLPTDEFVDTDQRKIPVSARAVRLVWRDISRPSQKRRVHATLLPAGPVTGNSVSVAYFRDGSLQRLLALLAVVSSLPFEFQVRSLLMTNHVSLSVMRSARIPELTNEHISTLAGAALACVSNGGLEAEARLERVTAAAFDLEFDAWSRIADHFELAPEERAAYERAWQA